MTIIAVSIAIALLDKSGNNTFSHRIPVYALDALHLMQKLISND